MRFILIVAAAALVLGCGSSSPSPVFTSVDGTWTYTTPDKTISVDFELKTTSGGTLEILTSTIKVNNVQGQAAGQLNGVSLPNINEIKVNANDVGLVYPYYISFVNCTVNAGFTQITTTGTEYTYPWGTTKSLTSVTITRK